MFGENKVYYQRKEYAYIMTLLVVFYGLSSINYCLTNTAAHQPFVTTFCCKFKPKAWQQVNKSTSKLAFLLRDELSK